MDDITIVKAVFANGLPLEAADVEMARFLVSDLVYQPPTQDVIFYMKELAGCERDTKTRVLLECIEEPKVSLSVQSEGVKVSLVIEYLKYVPEANAEDVMINEGGRALETD